FEHVLNGRCWPGRRRWSSASGMKGRNRPASALHRYGLTHRGSLVHLVLRSASASQPADRLDRVVHARDSCYARHTSRHLLTWRAYGLGAAFVPRLGQPLLADTAGPRGSIRSAHSWLCNDGLRCCVVCADSELAIECPQSGPVLPPPKVPGLGPFPAGS